MPRRRPKTKTLTYTVYFLPVPGDRLLVTCPAIPGLTNMAKTVEEARKVAKRDIEAYFKVLKKEGFPPPKDKDWIFERVEVTLPVAETKK